MGVSRFGLKVMTTGRIGRGWESIGAYNGYESAKFQWILSQLFVPT